MKDLPEAWLGRVVEIHFPERTKRMLVRIDAYEIAPSLRGTDKETDVWFWGRYA